MVSRRPTTCASLPGDLSGDFQVLSGDGWIEKCYADDLGGDFFYGLRTAVSVQVGGGVAGVDRVYGDASVAELVGELDGKHIERGL